MQWLSELLSDAWLSSLVGRPLNMEHFDVLEAEGNSSSTLVKVQCKQGPLLLKVTRQAPGDALAASVHREALFYQSAWQPLHQAGIGLLDLHAVDLRPDMSVIVLEFVQDGWRTGSNAGLSRCQAEALVSLLARLHAWGLDGHQSLPWLEDCRDGHLLKSGLPDLFRSSVSKITEEKILAALDTSMADAAGARSVMDMLQLAAKPGLYERAVDLVMQSAPITVVHLDARQGNAFFEEKDDPQVKLFDWQVVSRGAAALDLAYTLSGSLGVSDRRAWQKDLLALYIREFGSLSGSSYSLDQLKDDYRKALIWPLVWAALTFADVEGTVNHCAGPMLDASLASPEDVAKRIRAREVARDFVTVGAGRYVQAALDEGSAQHVHDTMCH